MDINDEIVLVPVPKSQLARVYAVLGTAMAQRSSTQASEEGRVRPLAPVDTGGVHVQGQGVWTEAKVSQLAAELNHPGTRALLAMVAEAAPRPVLFSDAASTANIAESKLRGGLSALSKITKRLFGQVTWPMSVRYGERGEAYYSMSDTMGRWWREATDEEVEREAAD